MAEYAQDEHALNLTSKGVNRTDSFTDTGYMAQVSYYLTGEDASYGAVSPLHPFDPSGGGLGAWSVAARVSNIATDTRQFQLGFTSPSLAAKTATEFAAGLNWILNNNIKYSFDYGLTNFYQGAGSILAPTNRPAESVFESQLNRILRK